MCVREKYMLLQISIQNFTIIEALELELQSGMTVLTGETGAGKSIIVDALLLALGGRADSNVIKHGAERCVISALFDIQKFSVVKEWLVEHELNGEQECLLRRTISNDGRSRAFINDQPVSVQLLRELGGLLVSIHGQHEHQTLLKADKQRILLDAYGDHESLSKKVFDLYALWRKTKDQLTLLQTQGAERNARYDLLKYQVQEFDKLALQPDEIAQLDQEQRQLAHAEQLIQSGQQLMQLIADSDEVNAIGLLGNIHTQLLHLQNVDSKFNAIAELINNAIIQTEEASNELRHYFDRVDLNPERLNQVEQRLTQIHEVARKHRVKPEELLALQQRLATELEQLEDSDVHIEQLQKQFEQLTQDYQKTAKELSQKRQKAAKKLMSLVEEKLQQLAMLGGKFKIEFTPNADDEFASYGLERIEFYVSANPGQPLQPLAKVASGGELSRISLAIHVLTAQDNSAMTLIFDEVDVGIGGGTAEIVGRLLRTLSQSSQVLCVTHLPQVAAQGNHHLQVSKTTSGNSTKTSICYLDKTDKIAEIARMLGGVKITKQTLAHAEEMLEIT